MKKVLILAFVLVLAAALIGPKIVGSQFATGIENTVQAINKNPSYSASISSMESTWFSTKAVVNVALTMPDMSDVTGQAPLDFSVNVDVMGKHGPFIFSDGFAIAWLRSVVQTQSPELPANLLLPNNDPFYQFKGLTGLFGSTTYRDSIAAIEYTDPKTNGVVSFTGLKGKGELNSDSIDYVGAADGLQMTVEDTLSLDIQNIVLDVNAAESITNLMTQGLYDSSSSLSIDLISFNDMTENTEVRIVDTKMNATSDYDKSNDLGGVSINTNIASVDAPDMNLTDLNTLIEVKNLQAKFILAYQEFSNKLMENAANPSQLEADMNAFVDTYLLEQLQAKPEYNFTNISGKVNGSEFKGNIMSTVTDIQELPESIDDKAFWMQHVLVTSELTMAEDAAQFFASLMISQQLSANPNFIALSEEEQEQIMTQQIEGTLQGLTQQGMLIKEDEVYKLNFSLEKGIALLNGNQIPL